MKEQGHCTPGVCPGTSTHGVTVSLFIHCNHPLLQLKRALPWDALFEVMRRHWQRAGKDTDGRPGLPWDVALYVPLVVDAGEAPQRARDGSVCVGECGGTGVHWPPGRPQYPDSGSFQYSPGPMRPWARTGSRRSMRCCSRWPKTVALPMPASCRPIPRRRSYLLGIPTNQGSDGGGRSAVAAPWRSSKPGRWWESIRPWHRCRRSSGQSKNTTSLPRANRPSARC